MIVVLIFLSFATASPPLVLAPGEAVGIHRSGPDGGAPVVLVPGLTGSAYGFRQLLPALHAGGTPTVVIEPLAVGSSSRPADADYTLTAQADRLAAAADSLDLSAVLWVAHGVSASMVFRLALARPDLVAAIVSLEGGPAKTAATEVAVDGLGFVSLVAKFGGKRLIRDRFAEQLRNSSGNSDWVTETVIRKYFSSFARDFDGTVAALRAMATQPEPRELVTRLDELTVPVLLLVGDAPEHLGALPDSQITLLGEKLPRFSVQTVAGAGHYLHEERPELVAAAILAAVPDTDQSSDR